MTKWEYKIQMIDPDSEYELNKLGDAGWELAGVRLRPASGVSLTLGYFKRPLPESKAVRCCVPDCQALAKTDGSFCLGHASTGNAFGICRVAGCNDSVQLDGFCKQHVMWDGKPEALRR